MKRFRVDIFDHDLNFVDMAQTAEPTLITDYLVQTASTFAVPKKLAVTMGNYAQVKSEEGDLFQGIVTDYAYDGKTTTVTFAQMSKLLDVEVFADVSGLASGIEPWMGAQIQAVYNGSDPAQNLAGLTVITSTATAGTVEENSNGIYNLYDLAVYFFKVYGVMIDISFDPMAKTITFASRVINPSAVWKIETRLADVADYSINSASNGEYPNKMIIRNGQDLTQEITYFWHPTDFAGTVNTDGSVDRVHPVVSRCAVVTPQSGQSFADASYDQAYSQMYQSKYDDQIEITFKSDSKLVEIGKIGQLYSIIDGDKTYHTVLTGFQRLNEKYTLLTFGYVRRRLTQILQMERRKQ